MAGILDSWSRTERTYLGATKPVYRRGTGPGVIVIHEIPGITPPVAAFGDRVAEAGFTVFMPSLFGVDGRERTVPYTIGSLTKACVSREFTCLATDRPSPVTMWLRALAADAHAELGGPGVGVVGMCLTGGFALAMMVDATVAAPVLSQPATPFPVSGKHRRSAGIGEAEWQRVIERAAGGCPVLGLRFTEDPTVPDERFETLRTRLGDAFVAIEIDSSKGNPHGIRRSAHSVLTEDLVDEPGHPTRAALDRVLAFLAERLET